MNNLFKGETFQAPMIVLISPAKTLEFDKTIPYKVATQPMFATPETEVLVKSLKTQSAAELAKLMDISGTLATLNYDRYKQWKTPFTEKNARQAIFTFNGPVYHGFDFLAYGKAEYERLQKTVRMISGLHGLLRPFDLIQAYRLDMHTPLPNPKGNDLYAYWKQRITDALNAEKPDVVVNCLSEEYGAAVDFEKIKAPVVRVAFKNFRNGKYVVMGLLAKKARGMYADFVVRENVTKHEDLKKFGRGGYKFDAKTSTKDKLVFLRKA